MNRTVHVPERTEARFVFPGDVVAFFPLDPGYPPLVGLVEAVSFHYDEMLIDVMTHAEGAQPVHVYVDTPVEIRVRDMAARAR